MEKKDIKDAYICYRRMYGGWEVARLINEALKKEGISSFVDVHDMKAGSIGQQILSAIDMCKYVILVLSGHCLDRCAEPTDWLRREIVKARSLNKPICPVFTSDFVCPKALPKEISFIGTMHGLQINEWNWSEVVQHIATAIDKEKEKFVENKLGVNKDNKLYTLIIKKGVYYIISFDQDQTNKELLNKYKQTIKESFNVKPSNIKVLSIDLDKKTIKEVK